MLLHPGTDHVQNDIRLVFQPQSRSRCKQRRQIIYMYYSTPSARLGVASASMHAKLHNAKPTTNPWGTSTEKIFRSWPMSNLLSSMRDEVIPLKVRRYFLLLQCHYDCLLLGCIKVPLGRNFCSSDRFLCVHDAPESPLDCSAGFLYISK